MAPAQARAADVRRVRPRRLRQHRPRGASAARPPAALHRRARHLALGHVDARQDGRGRRTPLRLHDAAAHRAPALLRSLFYSLTRLHFSHMSESILPISHLEILFFSFFCFSLKVASASAPPTRSPSLGSRAYTSPRARYNISPTHPFPHMWRPHFSHMSEIEFCFCTTKEFDKKYPQHTFSPSLPKCRTPTFATCPLYDSQKGGRRRPQNVEGGHQALEAAACGERIR